MSEISLSSRSRAEDASFRALADAAAAAAEVQEWRVIGGHMVNFHVRKAGLDLPLRATRDADLAVELFTINKTALIERIRQQGYSNTETANRFVKRDGSVELAIDVLAPSSTLQLEPNLDAGVITVDGVPGLRIALARRPEPVTVVATTTSKKVIHTHVLLPDLCSALALKVLAYGGRFAPRDAEDI